ncbi:hypothetical protein ACHAWF_003389 [Thalassiosira exigua]
MTNGIIKSIYKVTRDRVSETCGDANLAMKHHEYIKGMTPAVFILQYPEFEPFFGLSDSVQRKKFYDWFQTVKRMAARAAGVKVPPTPKKGKQTPTPKKTPKRKGTPVPEPAFLIAHHPTPTPPQPVQLSSLRTRRPQIPLLLTRRFPPVRTLI